MFFKLALLIYVIVRGYSHIAVWISEKIKIRDDYDTVLYVISVVAAVLLARHYHTDVLTALGAAGFSDIVLVQGRTLLDVVTDFCKTAVIKANNRRTGR